MLIELFWLFSKPKYSCAKGMCPFIQYNTALHGGVVQLCSHSSSDCRKALESQNSCLQDFMKCFCKFFCNIDTF